MSTDQLAIEGGPRARSRPDQERAMRIGALEIGEKERLAVDEVLALKILYRFHGSTVAKFESEFRTWLGAPDVQCLAVNSGTSALLLALAALDLRPGDEVLLPTLGFVSAATTILAVGCMPRFVPIDHSLGMISEMALKLVTKRTRALLAVHPYGSACDLTSLQAVAESFGGAIIEDAAQACGAEFKGRRVGTFGNLACFSFQYFKLLTTGEGGMVVTSDNDLFDRVCFMHDAAALWTMPERSARVERVKLPPLNLRMSELEGALGVSQLAKCDDLLLRMRTTKRVLRDRLDGAPGITLRPHSDINGDTGSALIFYVRNEERAKWLVAALQAEGVGVSGLRGEPGMNRHWLDDWLPILKKSGYDYDMNLPHMMDSYKLENGILFPIDIRYSQDDVDETILAFSKVVGRL